MKKVIVAIDSFKGCMSSKEANQAAAKSMPDAQVIQIPVSDGGEGWLEAFQSAMGGELVEIHAKDPLMRPIVTEYLIKGDTAVIEIAKASGLPLLSEEERNPMVATSYGTGQLVADAVRKGCKQIIVGLGGSATSDCGIGMLRAIIKTFAKDNWDEIRELDGVRLHPRKEPRQRWSPNSMPAPDGLLPFPPSTSDMTARICLGQEPLEVWAMLSCNTWMQLAALASTFCSMPSALINSWETLISSLRVKGRQTGRR